MPRLRLPGGAWDCHFHLFGPAGRFPFDPASPYVSGDALPEAYFELQRVLGLSRGVLVSGAPYGRDYSQLEHTLERFGPRVRGVVLAPEGLDAAEIRRLDALGVRGVRFVSERRRGGLPPLSPALAQRVFDAAGWQVHFYPGDDIEAQAPRLLALPNPIVLDHFGALKAERGVDQPAFQALLRLLDSGRVWVKLSGPMRCVAGNLPYAAVTPLARALVHHAPHRLVWGSDWPHVNLNDRAMPNDGDLVDLLAEWVPDAQARTRILVDNPAALFDRAGVRG
jgi:predicted TIM-barrel fold metal-dependent hydrolase